MKLMTVDDSRTIRRVISGIGSMLGYEVLEAENGRDAFSVLESHDDDEVGLILLDWNMPGMNGYEFLKKVKKDKRYQHIPVMMVTTEGERDYIIKAVQAGAAHYLTKPFTHEDMAARIMETMGMGSVA